VTERPAVTQLHLHADDGLRPDGCCAQRQYTGVIEQEALASSKASTLCTSWAGLPALTYAGGNPAARRNVKLSNTD
jgi:hypothetical protein